MSYFKRFMKFWERHHFSINMGFNVIFFAYSAAAYWDQDYKTAYERLLLAVIYTLLDLVIWRFQHSDDEE